MTDWIQVMKGQGREQMDRLLRSVKRGAVSSRGQ